LLGLPGAFRVNATVPLQVLRQGGLVATRREDRRGLARLAAPTPRVTVVVTVRSFPSCARLPPGCALGG
jgi:hypothetical protein